MAWSEETIALMRIIAYASRIVGQVQILQAPSRSTTTTYLYSMATRPVAQNGGAWEYLLADALGSVRQIVDANSNVTVVTHIKTEKLNGIFQKKSTIWLSKE